MAPNLLFIILAIIGTLGSTTYGQNNKGNHKEVEEDDDLETQASGAYGSYGGPNDVRDGGIYGKYPGHYSGGLHRGYYYGILRGLGTTGLEYRNFGYGKLGGLGYGYGALHGLFPGYADYGNLGPYSGYYDHPVPYR